MAYEYVNIRTDTIDNVKVPTKETLDARTIIESTLEPAAGADDKLYVYNIGLWQFPKTGFYKIKLTKVGALGVLLKLYARITKDDGTTPDDWDNNNLKAMGNASGDGLIEEIYAQVDYINDNKFTVYRVQFFNCFGYLGSFWVNTYDKTTQKWAYNYKHRVTADHVANNLTLTKGDVTTKFNGSVAREVSIPTKTSELTNDSFVSYAEQTLTEGQQNQAKTNLGIDVLTGNTTTVTPTQVKEAILAGRPVVITYTDTTYGNLTFTSFGYSLENNVVVANLVATSNNQYILADLTGIINTNYWTLQTTELGTSTDIANNYVKYSESQTLTDEQKATARTNIDAISSSELVQSDWNQNDTIAKDYIKNRICYEEETVTELGNTAEVWHNLTNGLSSTPISYRMNGKVYKDLTATNAGGSDRIVYNGSSSEAYLVVINYSSPVSQIILNYPSDVTDFQFVKIENTVKQIDSKFIHTLDAIAEQADATIPVNSKAVISVMNILLNQLLPSHYVGVFDQVFDEEKKQIARNNIGIKNPFKVAFTRSYGKVSADKTAKEIKDAANNGQFVYGMFDEDPANIYTLSISNQNDIRFNRLYTETVSNMGLCYSVFYINNPSDNFKGNYEETYCYNITAPSIKVVHVKLDNGTYKFDSTGAVTSYNEIFNICKTSDGNNYTNSDVFISYGGNKLYKLDQDPWSINNPLVFKRVSYDSTTSSILFETFTVNTDSTITYDSQIFKQSSTQSDWNENDTSSPAYIQNRPGGYYNSVASAESGTLSTTDFQDASAEFNTTSYIVTNEAFNTNLTNLKIAIGKTYKMSWVDSNKEYSYMANAVEINGTQNDKFTVILGDTTLDFTHNKLIWGNKSKVIFVLNGGTVTSTNTVTNIKIEELNIIKIPETFLDLSSVPEGFDLSNNYTATNKGSIKYIKTDRLDSATHYALLGFENEGNIYPKLKMSSQELDTSYVNATEYSSGSIKSSWVDHSETGDKFIHGIDINHDRYNKALILQSKLLDNTTEDLSVRGIATPTQDNSAVNKKYVDDQTYNVKRDISDNYLSTTSEQTLTDAQKQRALSNLGISIPEISVVTLDD